MECWAVIFVLGWLMLLVWTIRWFLKGPGSPAEGKERMPDQIVTLAMFLDTMAAEMAKLRLEAEGIPVALSGDTSGGLFAGLGGAFGTIHLQVAERDRKRAETILAEMEKDQEEGPGPEDSTAITAQKPEDEDEPEAPALDQDDAIQKEVPAKATAAPPGEVGIAPSLHSRKKHKDDDEAEYAIASGPEEIASRAWRAAVIGLVLFPPVLHVYSIWLLLRLSSISAYLTPAASRKMYGALLIDMAVLVAVVMAYLTFIR
jgi:hypothetical protein